MIKRNKKYQINIDPTANLFHIKLNFIIYYKYLKSWNFVFF